jgi:hypothetical protein
LVRMKRSTAAALALALLSPAHAQIAEPTDGATFQCDNGSRLVLSFLGDSGGLSAVVWLQGESYRLPHQPAEVGTPKVVWSDGEHSLTWSSGARLMWMSASKHVMCGRGGHKH